MTFGGFPHHFTTCLWRKLSEKTPSRDVIQSFDLKAIYALMTSFVIVVAVVIVVVPYAQPKDDTAAYIAISREHYVSLFIYLQNIHICRNYEHHYWLNAVCTPLCTMLSKMSNYGAVIC
jgi:hypothetical protein